MSTVSAAATTPAPAPARVAVVGGGVAGLAAAKALVSQKVPCTLLDMGGRGVGGRVSSRQLELSDGQPLSFDHGAQFFTAHSPDFQREVEGWAAAGAAQQWAGIHGRITPGGTFQPQDASSGSGSSGSSAGFFGATSGLPLWVGVPTNNAIPQHMARDLSAAAAAQEGQPAPLFELLSGCAVQSMERVGGGCGCGPGDARWRLRGSRRGRAAAGAAAAVAEQEDLGSYGAVILADAMTLLPGSAGCVAGIEEVSSSLANMARSVRDVAPVPCFALMVAFSSPLPGVPFDSASVEQHAGSSSSGSSSSSPFQWVACNSSKPGRPGSGGSGGAPQSWVALTTPQRAQQLLERHPLVRSGGKFNPQTPEYQAAVAAELLADFQALMAPFVQGAVPQPAYCHAQRWGRAFVLEPLGSELLFLPAQGLALCGDVALGSGVEAAWRSGRAAGMAVGSLVRSGVAA